jgi:hypothetical protein
VSKLLNQWIDLFRAGDHGDKGRFTEQDVQQIVDNYDPAKHEAPAVIGHPKTDGPAYGWWSQLRRVGGLLQGQMRDVQPSFEEAVQSGLFKKRSVSLYKGADGYSLRHVGFLGAQPPEIKGLADIKFEQEDQQAIEIEFSEETGMPEPTQEQQKTIMDSIRLFFEEKFGKPSAPASATFSEADVRRIAGEAAAAATAPLQAKLDAQNQTFSETQTAAEKVAAAGRAQAAIAQIKAKRAWVPAFDKLGLTELFSELATRTVTIEFGEGAAKVTKTPLELFTNFMEQLSAIVPNAPVYTGQPATAAPGTSNTPGVNDSQRAPADPNSVALDAKTREIMSSKNIDYGTAMAQAAAENPTLTVPGGAATGSV